MIRIPDTLKSRKVWLALILTPLLVILNRKLGLGLTDTDLGVIAAGVVGWIGVEGFMDAKTIERAGSPPAPTAPSCGEGKPADAGLGNSPEVR